MKKQYLSLISLTLISLPLMGNPVVSVLPGKELLEPGESQEIWVGGKNSETARTVDVHIGLISPDGKVYEYPDWNTDFRPWLSSFELSDNFKLPATLLSTLSKLPGGNTSGVWEVAAALTEPGTINILSLDHQPFIKNDNLESPKYGTVDSWDVNAGGFGAFGLFWNPLDAPDLIEKISLITVTEANVDQCQLGAILGTSNDILTSSFDAGINLTLQSSSNQNIVLVKEIGDGVISYLTDRESTTLEPGVQYTISSPGGPDIDKFSATLTAPERLLINPPQSTSNYSQSSGEDLELSWPNSSGQGVVIVTLFGMNSVDQFRSISCRFLDDGDATIHSNDLVEIKKFIAPSTEVQLAVLRVSNTPLQTQSNTLDFAFFKMGIGQVYFIDLL